MSHDSLKQLNRYQLTCCLCVKKCEARSHQCEPDAALEVRLLFEIRAAYNKLHFYMPGAVRI